MFLLSAFTIGLFGSLHCLGMCGPLMLVVQQGRPKGQILLETLLYQTGRISTYALVGFLFGSLGWGVHLFGRQRELAIATGVFILIAALFQLDLETPLKRIKLFEKLQTKLRKLFGNKIKNSGSSSRFFLGIINGLLPCGLVYLAVLGAANASSPWLGAAYMSCFGLGTLPLLLAGLYASYRFAPKLRKHIRVFTTIILLLTGALLIWRGVHYAVPAAFWNFQDMVFPPMCH